MRLEIFPLTAVAASFMLMVNALAPEKPQIPQTGTIRGVVVTSNDRKPIAQAIVLLTSSRRSVTTNDKGEFMFTDVPFGYEVAVAKKEGLLCAASQEANPECVKSIEIYKSDTQVELTMLPEAFVSGRIVDQEGTPIRNLALQLMERQFTEDGYSVWRGLGATHSKTDSNGVFEIAGVLPGSYLLFVPAVFDPPVFSPFARPDRGYSSTYYPGVSNQEKARPLGVHPGDEIRADFVVRRERVQSVTLNFHSNLPVEPRSLLFESTDSSGTDLLSPGLVEDGHFRLVVPPGDYEISFGLPPPTNPQKDGLGLWPDGTSRPYGGEVHVKVRNRPVAVNNVPLYQYETVDLPLQVRAQLATQESKQPSVPQIQPAPPIAAYFDLQGENFRSNNQFEWRADKPVSTFQFKNVAPGRYVLRATCNSSAYVASLTCGSLNLLREPLVIGNGAPRCSIEAVVRDDLASLSIDLKPSAKAQMAAYGTEVTDVALIPADNLLDLPYSGFLWISGPHKIMIPPGSYIAFLFDGRPISWREPEFQKRLKVLGTPVVLVPGENRTLFLDFNSELDSPKHNAPVVALGRLLP